MMFLGCALLRIHAVSYGPLTLRMRLDLWAVTLGISTGNLQKKQLRKWQRVAFQWLALCLPVVLRGVAAMAFTPNSPCPTSRPATRAATGGRAF